MNLNIPSTLPSAPPLYFVAHINDNDAYNQHINIKTRKCGCKRYIFSLNDIVERDQYISGMNLAARAFMSRETGKFEKLRPDIPLKIEEMNQVKKPLNCSWHIDKEDDRLICIISCNEHLEEIQKDQLDIEYIFKIESNEKIKYVVYGYLIPIMTYINYGEIYKCRYCHLCLGECLTYGISIYPCKECLNMVCFKCSKYVWRIRQESICKTCPAPDVKVECVLCREVLDPDYLKFPILFNHNIDYKCRKCVKWTFGKPNISLLDFQIKRAAISKEIKAELFTKLKEFEKVIEKTYDNTIIKHPLGWVVDDAHPTQADLGLFIQDILEGIKNGTKRVTIETKPE